MRPRMGGLTVATQTSTGRMHLLEDLCRCESDPHITTRCGDCHGSRRVADARLTCVAELHRTGCLLLRAGVTARAGRPPHACGNGAIMPNSPPSRRSMPGNPCTPCPVTLAADRRLSSLTHACVLRGHDDSHFAPDGGPGPAEVFLNQNPQPQSQRCRVGRAPALGRAREGAQSPVCSQCALALLTMPVHAGTGSDRWLPRCTCPSWRATTARRTRTWTWIT